MKKEFIVGAVAVVVLAVTGIWLAVNASTTDQTVIKEVVTHPDSDEHQETYVKGDAKNSKITIVYTNKGFDPSSTTVKSGDTITIRNTSSVDLELATGTHEHHTHDPDLRMSAFGPGKDVVVVLLHTGVKQIHNHDHAEDTMTINVTE